MDHVDNERSASSQQSEIAIIGYGHVGSSLQQLFPGSLVYDPYRPDVSASVDDINGCELAFVCVPTPARITGEADTSIVEEVVGWLDCKYIVLRSTVPPGTTARLASSYQKNIAFWPEYYGEWSYPTPQEWSLEGWPFVIVGGDPGITSIVVERLAMRLGPMKTYRQTSAELAELCKYMENCWLASQNSFAWQFRLIADALSLDYWELRELWALDPRVSKTHTGAWAGARGFDGKCLPKDLRSAIAEARRLGIDATFLEAVYRFNNSLRSHGDT